MDNIEEQQLEVEALEAIFMEDFSLERTASEETGAIFRLMLTESETQIRLSFSNPVDYPTQATCVTVHGMQGLSAPQRRNLQTALTAVCKECVPAPAVYAVTEAAREWISAHVSDAGDGDGDDDGHRFETVDHSTRNAVEFIAAKCVGTPVTVESFMRWRAAFLAEIAERDDVVRNVERKMTGREMFEARIAVVSGDSESFWEMEADGFEG